ncbi:hypothetical protein EYF80_025235 [Liparis tanakae]|uniref:Uncharacterized protein n=1 Tax=Liparis tanakae TaxID=230148 RepID=A0A4Z2HF32_9TELE|nr:hypothetical protein EYF80_025235 [Liparis tanakae]
MEKRRGEEWRGVERRGKSTGPLDNPVDVDAGDVDVLFGKGPHLHHLLHLHGDTRGLSSTSTCKMSHDH